MDDERYYSALVLMFEQALKGVTTLPEISRGLFLNALVVFAPLADKSAGVLATKWPTSGAHLRNVSEAGC